MARQPKIVSLFSGAGGLDIGLENAGFRVVLCVDNDQEAVETLKKNQLKRILRPDGRRYLERTIILHEDITELTASKLESELPQSDIDLLIGGPPCQPFSSAGKMLSFKDPRGTLFEHFVRIAKDLRPHYILFENVRGLATARGVDGKPGSALNEILKSFTDIGYHTSVSLLNSADYGSHQRRVRLFILMCSGATPPNFPSPKYFDPTKPNKVLSLFEKEKQMQSWKTLSQFLDSFPSPTESEIVRPSNELAKSLKYVTEGSGLKSAGTIEATRPGGHWGYKQGTFIADPAKPARTVTAASTQDWVRMPDGSLRRLTVRECQALQGFPLDWEFIGGNGSKYRQIGNAVPIIFGEAIGTEIKKHWLRRLRRKFAPEEGRSKPLPAEIIESIEYTTRDEKRNAESRRLKLGKGLGSASHGKSGKKDTMPLLPLLTSPKAN